MMRERTKQKGGVGVGEWGADSILNEQAGGLAVFLDMSLPSCGTWTKLLQTCFLVCQNDIWRRKKSRYGKLCGYSLL